MDAQQKRTDDLLLALWRTPAPLKPWFVPPLSIVRVRAECVHQSLSRGAAMMSNSKRDDVLPLPLFTSLRPTFKNLLCPPASFTNARRQSVHSSPSPRPTEGECKAGRSTISSLLARRSRGSDHKLLTSRDPRSTRLSRSSLGEQRLGSTISYFFFTHQSTLQARQGTTLTLPG